MNKQTWNAQQYQAKASYVAELGSPVLELLNPQPHEAILDLGCGDGSLTRNIADVAEEVVGIDSSESMVRAAKEKGLTAFPISGDAIPYSNQFDAVFTNAALHWIPDYQSVIQGVHNALKPNGRFIGEFGGYGNIKTLVEAMETVVDQNEAMGQFSNPWFFPSADEYRKHLEDGGFSVVYIELLPRPTHIEAGIREWFKIFADYVISGMPEELEDEFLMQTEQLVKPSLFTEEDGWFADYVRLRFHAIKA